MLRLHSGPVLAVSLCVTLFAVSTICFAQESRGSITGKILDPQNAIVPNANIVVTNVETNVAKRTVTNQTGYFEVIALDPGTYSVSVDAAGFKKVIRSGIVLNTGDRLAVDVPLEIGQSTQAIEVSADAPLLETTNAAGGRVLDSRDIAQLPYTTMNPFSLQAIAPGMIFTGTLGNNRVMDHAGTASYETAGLGSGAGEFLLDGNPVTGTNGGRAGFVPSSEAVSEIRVETAPFDAAMGHAVGAYISATIKSGNNTLHGSAFEQMEQFRWNAANHFTRLSGQPKPGGKFSQPGFSIGGPVYIPKVINGKNKLFFYLEFDKITQKSPPINNNPLYTVPTVAERQGDFSALLQVPVNPTQYLVYDPRTAALVNGHVTRTPFPNNVIPASMMTNPIYKFMSQLYPLPNNPAGLVQPDGTNNFYDGAQPNNDFFTSLINRYDYSINQKQRLSGKWYYNHRFSDQYDFAHNTPLAGYYSNGLWRPTRGGSLNYTYTLNATNVLDVTASVTQYSEGSKQPVKLQYKASDVGLPAYIDQKAGGSNALPALNIAGVANAASTSFIGYPGLNQRGTTWQLHINMTTIHGAHTLKYGWEDRRYYYATVNPLGNTTGYYQFNNTYVRQADNTTTASNTGLGWAAFALGMPNSISLDTNDTAYYGTRYHALYMQDDFRVTSRLRFGFGVRMEREGGTTERFNRGLAATYDFSFVPPYAQAVQSSYASILSDPANAANPAVQLLKQASPASQFVVAGGVTYLGQKYPNYTAGTTRFLPNLSMVYQIDNKTVLRFGTGWFGDTFSSVGGTGNRPPLTGYSQTTTTILTNDLGLTFCCGASGGIPAASLGAVNPMMNPFPVLPSGSRWVLPFGNSLGSNILDGAGYTSYPRDYSPTWEQRWKASVQRELHGNHMIDISYNGAYGSSPFSRSLSALPAQYWNYYSQYNANVAAVDNAMKAMVTNPFKAALPGLQTSNPTLYNYLSNVGLFTANTLQVQQLLRANPNANFGLSQANAMRSKTVYHDVEILYQKRWSKGFQSSVMYTRNWSRNQWAPNQFDQSLAWQPNANSRPNRFVWTTVWELPFGKGRQWLTQGPAQHMVGGWQLSWIYQYQTGALISWGNLFYYGSVDQIVAALNHDQVHAQNIHQWFDPAAVYQGSGAVPAGFTGFEGRSSFQPGTYQARVFPQYIDSLRADGIRNWDVRVYRKFRLHERLNLNFSVDLENMTNHTQFSAPNIGVTASNFGTVTGQANQPRIIQLNGRIEF
ncbi:MAG: carboxypeptidase regulatory-like domain-containing protein [Acidobacteriia bacterium]|nr:carboxypeptidase regulatory-like domain-containing protein [Terriglobia bacterium]